MGDHAGIPKGSTKSQGTWCSWKFLVVNVESELRSLVTNKITSGNLALHFPMMALVTSTYLLRLLGDFPVP